MNAAVSANRPWRILVAFLVAPAAAALVYAVLHPLYAGRPSYADRLVGTTLFYGGTAIYPATVMLGIPLYAAFRPRLRLTALNCGLAGVFVLAIPAIILVLMPERLAYAANLGLAGTLAFIGEAAILGVVGGLTFWLIATGGRSDRPRHA